MQLSQAFGRIQGTGLPGECTCRHAEQQEVTSDPQPGLPEPGPPLWAAMWTVWWWQQGLSLAGLSHLQSRWGPSSAPGQALTLNLEPFESLTYPASLTYFLNF